MNIKKLLKHTYVYQKYKMSAKLPYSMERYSSFKDDEKANKFKLCGYAFSKRSQLNSVFRRINISFIPNKRFQSWIDTGMSVFTFGCMVDNIPPNYEIILENSLKDLKSTSAAIDNEVGKHNVWILGLVEDYIERIIHEMESMIETEDPFLENTWQYFKRMKNYKAECLEEALQRIIFWSSIFWQTNHRLVGLGRLDKLLIKYCDDLEDNVLSDILIDFCNEMHRYYAYKSNHVSMGDTGQIIILGGIEPNGTYYCNRLTYSFIEILKKHRLPDPKLLLRVSNKMPDELLRLAIECIATGIGCPLISNDDVVIPSLKKFGYIHEDACNYVTSACWEPLAYGKSLEKNNIVDLNYAKVFVETYKSTSFTDSKTFDDVMSIFYQKLDAEINNIKKLLSDIKWEYDPLMTLFTEGCLKSGKDISEGGAVYNDYGILTSGLGNTVDSLLNVKYLVFEQRRLNLADLADAAKNDLEDEDLRELLEEHKYFGHDDSTTIALINEIRYHVYKELAGFRNKFGGKVKWGFSSSNYAELGKSTGATLDGRRSGGNLTVHMSAARGEAYSELFTFAGSFDYSGHFSNGNVVDFFVTPSFIISNFDKFVLFIKTCIAIGFFQAQMNVVDSQTLIEAKMDPERYPDLIVRVWGFSAYFNELPEYYKDVLIKRALDSEGPAD